MLIRVSPSERDRKELRNAAVDPRSLEDDFFDYSKVVIRKPWGLEYLIFQNKEVMVWVLHIAQGHQTSTHCHPNKRTSLIVLSGKAECTTFSGKHAISPGHGLLIEKGVFHSTRALSREGIMIMEIEQGTNKKDLVRLHDQYGRSHQGYESSAFHEEFDSEKYRAFHKEETRYTLPRQYGECEVTIHKLAASDLSRITESIEGDIVALLRGFVYDEADEVICEAGEAMLMRTFKERKGHRTPHEVELLTIQKRTS